MKHQLMDLVRLRVWLTFLLLALSGISHANSPVLIPNESFDYGVTPYVSIFEDRSASLTISQMLTSQRQLRFSLSHADKLKFGLTDSAYWLRISVSNPYKHERQVVLSLSNPDLGQVTLYDLSDDNEPQTYSRYTRQRIGGYIQAFPFLLEIPTETTNVYLIRVQSDSILNTEVRLASIDNFLFNEQWDYVIQGLALGWILATLLYFLHVYHQQKMLLALAAASYCATVLVFLPGWTGLAGMVINIGREAMAYTSYLALALSAVAHAFTVYSLGWRNKKIEKLIIYISIAYLVVNLAVITLLGTALQFFLALSLVFYGLFTSLLLIFAPSNHLAAQRYLAYGAVGLTAGLVLTLLTIQNLLAMEFLHDWAILLLPAWLITSMVAAIIKVSNKSHKTANAISDDLTITPAMLSHLSHELRSPINGVIGMSELMNDTPLSNNQRDFLDTISQAGRELLHVVNQVSDLGKVQDNRLAELEKNPVDIRGLLNTTLQHFQQESVRKQMELVIDVDDQVPQSMLGDKVHLQSLLHTILNKSLAYGEHGELTLAAQLYNTTHTSGLMLQLRMNSHIARHEELKHSLQLLQPDHAIFSRDLEKQWNMLVLRKVMKRMKATLEIENFSMQGASLSLYLPLETDQTIHPELHDDSLIGQRILVVDDNATVRNVIEKQLKRLGVRPESTYSGKEALAMMRNQCTIGEPFDLAIIDHDMPLMNGLQLSERIMSDADISTKPARLMLTGMSISQVREEALKSGIQKLLAKPADPEQLRLAILSLQA